MNAFILTQAAWLSLKNISRYTRKRWGERQRDVYMHALDVRFRDLAQHPKKGKIRTEIAEGLYSFPEGKHVIYYRIRKRSIRIIEVLHEQMDAKARLS